MNILDIIIGGLIVFGLVVGFIRGFFVEVASLVALIAGIYGAIHFSYYVGDFLEGKVDWEQKYINLAAFITTFVIIIIVVSLAGKLLTKIADFAALGILNRMLGGLFGGLKVAVILGALLIFFDRTNNTIGLFDKNNIEESALYAPVMGIGAMVFDYVLKDKVEINGEKL